MNALTAEQRARIPAPGSDYMVVAKCFRGKLQTLYVVLFEGRFYTVNHHLLACMERGETPAELELTADEEEE